MHYSRFCECCYWWWCCCRAPTYAMLSTYRKKNRPQSWRIQCCCCCCWCAPSVCVILFGQSVELVAFATWYRWVLACIQFNLLLLLLLRFVCAYDEQGEIGSFSFFTLRLFVFAVFSLNRCSMFMHVCHCGNTFRVLHVSIE